MTTETTTEREAASRPRLLYIDNLRILLTSLVILHHLAIGYGGLGDWIYNEVGEISDISTILLTLFLAINQSFFMGFFFMISSYFNPGSIDRKGSKDFFIDRMKRLGIPLVFFTFVLIPLTVYPLVRAEGYIASLVQYFVDFLSHPRNYDFGPMWFVAMLLIFASAYLLVRALANPADVGRDYGSEVPANAAIAMFALALGVATFAVRIWIPVGVALPLLNLQPGHAVQYVALFTIGILAYRRHWFSNLGEDQARFWLRMILGLVVVFPILFIAVGALEGNVDAAFGGFHWQSLAYSVWEQFMGMAVIVTLLVFFRDRLNHQGTFARKLSAGAYATYIFHATVIVLLALALRGIRLDLALKWLLVAPVALSLSFFVGYVVKQLPLAKDIV
jgi:hypothetical protein